MIWGDFGGTLIAIGGSDFRDHNYWLAIISAALAGATSPSVESSFRSYRNGLGGVTSSNQEPSIGRIGCVLAPRPAFPAASQRSMTAARTAKRASSAKARAPTRRAAALRGGESRSRMPLHIDGKLLPQGQLDDGLLLASAEEREGALQDQDGQRSHAGRDAARLQGEKEA